jgi:beta-galactosidase
VENTSGKGRTLLIGSFPGAGYFRRPTPQARTFFAGLLDWAGIPRTLTVSDPLIKARLHRGAGSAVLYVINPTRQERPVVIELSDAIRGAKDVWENKQMRVDGRRLLLTVGDRDVAVVQIN